MWSDMEYLHAYTATEITRTCYGKYATNAWTSSQPSRYALHVSPYSRWMIRWTSMLISTTVVRTISFRNWQKKRCMPKSHSWINELFCNKNQHLLQNLEWKNCLSFQLFQALCLQLTPDLLQNLSLGLNNIYFGLDKLLGRIAKCYSLVERSIFVDTEAVTADNRVYNHMLFWLVIINSESIR